MLWLECITDNVWDISDSNGHVLGGEASKGMQCHEPAGGYTILCRSQVLLD